MFFRELMNCHPALAKTRGMSIAEHSVRFAHSGKFVSHIQTAFGFLSLPECQYKVPRDFLWHKDAGRARHSRRIRLRQKFIASTYGGIVYQPFAFASITGMDARSRANGITP